MAENPSMPEPKAGFVPWLVGLLALWQIAFIPLANAWEWLPRRPTPADDYPERSTTQRWGRFTNSDTLQVTSERIGDVFAFWAEATGQDQGWNMFTPDFPPHTVVPIAELKFADGRAVRVESRFSPADPERPGMRWPLVHDREFNYEANITMLGWHATPEAIAARPEHGRELPERVRENHELLSHWLAWKTRVHLRASPGEAVPVEVVLVFRYIPTPLPNDPPGAPRRPSFERPFARWRPGGPRAPGLLPLEGFDPVTERFVELKVVSPP
ncbi:hypothetical protein GobsT_01710 [Gemmata obscuriglobus]|uniref:Uncharacterized protein n=2 Tax=Gemmata obscuriglobus TaxID=114 RepID=A0A2Z3H5B8_9BACT|nr:hypothetical protein C1280_32295 [Gemmata obscuriglobus]QEG25445.1 hypothetical protein GobsT_01710 [Gemmata obscuriglobus]VTR98600.1 unnamed protein product [Gemmata obscuriglobus UQM 2246]